jgi:uncharacterized protein (DUF305 family)
MAMMTRRWVGLVTLALVVALLVLGAGTALARGGPGGMAGTVMMRGGGMGQMGQMMDGAGMPMMGQLPGGMGMMGGDDELHFIEQMIPHHEGAIAMAELALSQAEHPAIKDLAANIKKTQTEEIDRMRAWYRAWYRTAVPAVPQMGGMMGGMGHDLDALQGADPFDKAFIEQMIPHHRMAVMMAQMALPRATHDELKALLRNIIDDQSAEIAQMKGWYHDWYKAEYSGTGCTMGAGMGTGTTGDPQARPQPPRGPMGPGGPEPRGPRGPMMPAQ